MGLGLAEGEVFSLPPEEARHLRKVLRARAGDAIEVVDAEGVLFASELLEGSKARAVRRVAAASAGEAEVVLYQAVPKGRHMDLVVEKATEVGVSRVVPVQTGRGVVRLRDAGAKVERWRRVAEAAARQSLRLRIPPVEEPVAFGSAVEEAGPHGVLLHNEGGLPSLEDLELGSSVGLFVGPEGGFAEAEISAAGEAGLALAQLGPYRLRSETAGIVAVARARAILDGSRGRKTNRR